MQLFSGGQPDFFGLDVGSGGVRFAQLKAVKQAKSLLRYGELPIRLVLDDPKASAAATIDAVNQLVKKATVPTKNLVANLPSNKAFTTIVDMPRLNPGEMAKAIAYQAPSLIPTALDQSKIDWAVIGPSPNDVARNEVLLSSVPKDYVEARLEMFETAGYNVLAFEPDAMALTRSLIPAGSAEPYLLLDMGHQTSDMVIAMGGAPRLARSVPVATDQIIKAAQAALNVEEAQAEQYIFKFGLSPDKFNGQIQMAITPTIDALIGELAKSIRFFQDRYHGSKINKLIVTGGAAILPELPLYLANHFNMSVEIGNAWRNIVTGPAQPDSLLAVSNRLAVAVGLAMRTI